MTILQSIFLGLLQGLTEFLPVSSSGHLLLAQKLFGIEADLFFDVMLHLGTLFAVVVAMRKTLFQTIAHPVADKRFRYVAIACIPTFAIAAVVHFFVPEATLNLLLPLGFAATIVLIVLSAKLGKPTLRLQETGLLPIIVTGVVQGIAVCPGLSRSGSTVSTMKLFGVNSTDSAEFSFMLSVPVILGAVVVEGYKALKTAALTVNWLCVGVGVVTAFVSGLIAVYTVMRAVKRGNWIAFAVYLALPLVTSLIVMF